MTAREYAEKNKIRYVEHRDGSVSIRYRYKKRDADFSQKLLYHGKRIEKLTQKKYVPNSNNFNYSDWPLIKVKMTFK